MLESFQIWFAVIPAIILFLYGIDNFSKEMQKAIGSQFKFLLKWVTKGKFRAALFGAVITALIQTSAATTIIAISLVNSGTITFTQSLGIIFGTNFGSVLTSQLVAFNLMQFASLLIILGFVLSLINSKYKILGKPIFYFGLVMFALNLISLSIIPLKSDPNLILLLSKTSIIPIGILVGFLVTNLFQSGAVTTGLVVIFAQNGMLGLNEALPILFGVNIGKTILSLLVSIRMDSFAKRAAVSHFLYNVIGVLISIPFMGLLISIVQTIGGNPAHQVANAHLIFSVSTTIILLIFINQFQKLIEKLIPTKEEEIILRTKNLEDLKDKNNAEILNAIELELKNSFDAIRNIFKETNIILLSTKRNNNTIRISKLSALIEHIHFEIKKILVDIFKNYEKTDNEKILLLARTSILCEKIGLNGKKLGEILVYAKENNADFSEEGKQEIDFCISKLSENILIIQNNFPNFKKSISIKMAKNGAILRSTITKSYSEYLKRLSTGQSTSGSVFAETMTLIQDIESDVRELRKICEK